MKINYENLLDNSIEFIKSSIKFYHEGDYKNAIISLWSGILLLLKCKVFRIHPILLASDILDCVKLSVECSITYESFEKLKNDRQLNSSDIDKIRDIVGSIYGSKQEILDNLTLGIDNKERSVIKKYSRKSD